MSKQITFKIDKDEYVLEYDRAAIQEMESEGFRINEIDVRPFTMIPMLVHGAFKKHHSALSYAKVEEVWNTIGTSDTLVAALSAMIAEQAESLVPSDKNNTENPIKLTLNFDLDK